MGFPTALLILKLNISLINLNNITDNILNHKQLIKLYYEKKKQQFYRKYKIDEHTLKKSKKCSPYRYNPKSKTYHFLQQI